MMVHLAVCLERSHVEISSSLLHLTTFLSPLKYTSAETIALNQVNWLLTEG